MEVKLKKGTIEFYDGIREMPIINKHNLGKLVIQDLQIGDDINSVSRHFETLHKYIGLGKYDEAVSEAKNLHNNFYYMIEGMDISSYSFITFVKSINKEAYNDLSLSGVKETIHRLSDMGLTVGHVEDLLFDLKKKLTMNFVYSFLIDTETYEPSLQLLK